MTDLTAVAVAIASAARHGSGIRLMGMMSVHVGWCLGHADGVNLVDAQRHGPGSRRLKRQPAGHQHKQQGAQTFRGFHRDHRFRQSPRGMVNPNYGPVGARWRIPIQGCGETVASIDASPRSLPRR